MTDKIEEFKPVFEESGSTKEQGVFNLAEILTMPLDLLKVYGLIETVTVVPTAAPTKLYEQIKLYTDSLTTPTVYRLYFYMVGTNNWHYCTLS